MKGSQKFIATILLGAAAGAGIAYFLSTDKGKEVLATLKEKAEALVDDLNEAAANTKDDLTDLLAKGKAYVADLERKMDAKNT